MTQDEALRLGAQLLRDRAAVAPNLAGKHSRPEVVIDLLKAAQILEEMRRVAEKA